MIQSMFLYNFSYLVFDYRSHFLLWLVTFVLSLFISLHLLIFLISSHCFFWSMLFNVSGLFKIVRLKLSRLDECTEKIRFHKELVEIVHFQETAYRSARALENALNVLMLILYSVCLTEICMTMTALSMVCLLRRFSQFCL